MARTRAASRAAKTKTKKVEVTQATVNNPTPTYAAPVVDGPYSFSSFVNWVNNNFGLLVVTGLVFIGGFFIGSLWTENQMLKNGSGGRAVANAPAAPAAPAAPVPAEPAGPTPEQLKSVPPVSNEDHVRGNQNAQVTLIEYSDYECPFCARFHPTMVQVMQEYGDKIKWVYRHYPLPFHPNAQKAAEAAECVAKLAGNEKFWEYSDKLFEENNKLGGSLTPAIISSSAVAVGVNESAFKTCLDSGEMAAKVKAQMDAGSAAGISGTPGTILLTADGEAQLISGAVPLAEVKATLDQFVK